MKNNIVKIHIFLCLLVYIGATQFVYFINHIPAIESKSKKDDGKKSNFEVLKSSNEATTSNNSYLFLPISIYLKSNIYSIFKIYFFSINNRKVENCFKKILFSKISPSNAP